MNIFKILANGEGRINETNVSAFLGYLLDPKANHSLGYEFLRRFLDNVDGFEDEFDCEKFDYEIFFEQGFKKEDKKQKVDIVVVCTKTDNGDSSETKVKNYINNSKSIKKVFLIENKILKGSITENQINKQYEFFNYEFNNKDAFEVYSIYVTPNNVVFDKEFENNTKLSNKTHICWKNDNTQDSIKSILIDIVNKESKAEIEAINEYTRHTLKSFIQFIETDFKSEKEIEKERKKPGKYTKKEKKLNKDFHIEEKLTIVRERLIEEIPNIKVGEPNLSRPKNPELIIYIDDILIAINAGFKSRNIVNLSYRVNPKKENSRVRLEQLSNAMNINLKNASDKKLSYFNTQDMRRNIPIDNFDEINLAVGNAIKNIENVFNETIL